jgi:hypothetical protein
LDEVPVEGEGVGDPQALNDHEARGVGQ